MKCAGSGFDPRLRLTYVLTAPQRNALKQVRVSRVYQYEWSVVKGNWMCYELPVIAIFKKKERI